MIEMTRRPILKPLLIILLLLRSTLMMAQNNLNTEQQSIEKGKSETRILSLDETIDMAHRQSPDALSAIHRFRSSYWQYRNYKAGLMPTLALDATVPSLYKTIQKSADNDKFNNINNLSYSGGLSLSKTIGLTGGTVFVRSNLERFIDLEFDTTYFSTIPLLSIGFEQNLFGFNEYKWLKKTQPLKYNEAERRYVEDREQININASNAFFRLLDAQIRLRIQEINLANNDTLFQIAKGRFNIGTIAENELLQIELSLLNARAAVEQANIELEMRTFELKSYLRIPDNVSITLVPPGPPPQINPNAQQAVNYARENRSDALSFDRRLLEAQMGVNQAKAKNMFDARLSLLYGLNQAAGDLEDAYKDPREQQVVRVGLTVPILDWGFGKSQVKLAESNMELERTSVQQDIVDFDQEVLIKVMQFRTQPIQYSIASKSDTVALKRYEVTKQRYLIGKIGITDLNIAQTEKDNAQQGYVSSLSSYWRSYFELRKLTLFDFVTNQPIRFDLDDIPNVD
jgi:outer membrane protein